MATEYHRLGFAQATNPAAYRQGPGAEIRDLFDRPEALEADGVDQAGKGVSASVDADGAGQGALAPSTPHPTFEAKAEIWREFRKGRISLAEAQRRSATIGALANEAPKPVRLMYGTPGKQRPPVARPRQERPTPNESRQYANPMATTAARDDRLTPQAKALLQVIRARAGKGTETITTKGTLAAILARSTRSITRYLRDLERCGYLKTRTRADSRGFHLGLALTITEKVLPFFSEMGRLAKWLGESAGLKPVVPFMPFSTATPGSGAGAAPQSTSGFGSKRSEWPEFKGVTLLSSKNQFHNDSFLSDSNGLRRNHRVAATSGD